MGCLWFTSISSKGTTRRYFMAIGFVWALKNPWHVWKEKALVPKATTSFSLPACCQYLAVSMKTNASLEEASKSFLQASLFQTRDTSHAVTRTFELPCPLLHGGIEIWPEWKTLGNMLPLNTDGPCCEDIGELMLVSLPIFTQPNPPWAIHTFLQIGACHWYLSERSTSKGEAKLMEQMKIEPVGLPATLEK